MQNPKNILILTDSFEGGGAERVVVDLAKASSRINGVKIILAASRKIGPLLKEVPPEIAIYEYGPYRGLANSIRLARKLKEICKREQIAYIFSNMTTLNKATLKAKLLTPSLPPIAVVEHTEMARQFLEIKSIVKRKLRPLEVSLLYPHANHVIVVSNPIAYELNKYCGIPLTKCTTINNPVDPKRISLRDSIQPKSANAKDEDIRCLAIGRLIKDKDFHLLIDSFKLLRKNGHGSAKLRILGEGPERKNLERTVTEFNLNHVVELPGFTDDISSHLAWANLFASTSRYEGFGNSIVEAIGSGLPVVATKTAGSVEISNKTGAVQISESRDPQEFCSAMEKSWNYGRSPSKHAREFVSSLDPRSVIERYLDLVK